MKIFAICCNTVYFCNINKFYIIRKQAYEYNRLETEADSIGRVEYDDSEFKELHNELCLLGSDHPEYFDTFLLYMLVYFSL